MKKTLIALAMASLSATASAEALTTPNDTVISGGYAQKQLRDAPGIPKLNGYTIQIQKNLNEYFALQGGFADVEASKDLGFTKISGSLLSTNFDVKLGFDATVNDSLVFHPYAKMGVVYLMTDVTASGVNLDYLSSDLGADFGMGLETTIGDTVVIDTGYGFQGIGQDGYDQYTATIGFKF
ncbi:outer membrane beta-barrel protein [Vibrio breoganii]|uniref:outer membrane beta-barrel protein n=1 Tax=Vibrio breoganii TaxID=553239 RepID=UPI000C81A04B|nr:outer membrane beta-barrel protein [Vibrio breoganii]PMK30641.1 hypothetical protein BCU03_09495 [Vibrio breoganii]